MKKETIGSLFELFKLSLRKMCTTRVLLPLAIFTLITTNIVPYISTITYTTAMSFVVEEDAQSTNMIGMVSVAILFAITFILYALFLSLVYIAAPAYFVSTEKHRMKTDAKNILSLIKKRWIKITLTMLVVILLSLLTIGVAALLSFISPYLALLAGFVVSVYLISRFYVALYPAVYDGFGAIKSLNISTIMMEGNKGKVVAFMGLLMLIYILATFVVYLPIGALIYFTKSPEYLLFLADRPVTEDFMESITTSDYGFRELIGFVSQYINSLLGLISSGIPALLYLKRREATLKSLKD